LSREQNSKQLNVEETLLVNRINFSGIERGLSGFPRIFLYFFRSAQIRLIRVYQRSIPKDLASFIKGEVDYGMSEMS
jgi:hypothetical protein